MTSEGKQIFNLLQKKGAMTKGEISKITGTKLTTLNRIMQPLENSKILVQYRVGESTGGRKPIVYNINLCNFYMIGIDISINYVEIVFTNLRLQILHKEIFQIDYKFTPVKIIDNIEKLISKVYEELNLDFLELFGIGVSVPGSYDFKSGVLHGYTKMWDNVEIENIIIEKLEAHVFIENGANAAVTAEYFYGLETKFNNIAYVNCGEKLKTGIIVDGKILRAFNNEEDLFGHMVIDKKQYSFGNLGCIESYASTSSIVKNFIFQLRNGRSSIIDKVLNEITCKDIYEAADAGDVLSIEIIEDAAVSIGIGLINLIQMFNLKVIILDGEIILNSKIFYDKCVKTALKTIKLSWKNEILFRKEDFLEKDIMAVGAAANVIEKYIED